MAKLEAEAANRGISSERSVGPENSPEVMVGFPPNGPRRAELDLYHSALAGTFGKLKIEVILLAVSAASKGTEAAIAAEPSFIVDPKH